MAALAANIEYCRVHGQFQNLPALARELAKHKDAHPALEYTIMGEGWIHKDDAQKARDAFERALEMDPKYEDAMCWLAKLDLMEGKVAEAAKRVEALAPLSACFASAAKLTPYQLSLRVQARNVLSTAYEELDDVPKAIAVLERVTADVSKLPSTPPLPKVVLDRLEETCVRLPRLHVNVMDAVEAYRTSLRMGAAKLSDGVKSILFHGLATALVHFATDYVPIDDNTQRAGVYTPNSALEEGILAFLLYEHHRMTLRKDPPVSLYDNMVVGYMRARQPALLVEVLQRALGVHWNDTHLWAQLALALIAAGDTTRALTALKQDVSESESAVDPMSLLLAAKLSINEQGRPADAIEYLKQMEEQGTELKPRFVPVRHHLFGLAYAQLAHHVFTVDERSTLHAQSIQHLEAAFECEQRQDYLVAYHLALQFAEVRDISKAIKYCRASLQLNKYCGDAWNLLALLLSSRKNYEDAFRVCQLGLDMDPRCSALRLTTGILEQKHHNTDKALRTHAEHLATLLGTTVDAIELLMSSVDEDAAQADDLLASGSSGGAVAIAAGHPRGGGTTTSGGASGAGGAGGPATGKAAGGARGRMRGVGALCADVWLEIADIYRAARRYQQATHCVMRALHAGAPPDTVQFSLGFVAEAQGNVPAAVAHYQSALAVNPNSVGPLVRLGIVHMDEGTTQAHHYLSTAVRMDATNHQAWYNLGKVLKKQGLTREASDAFFAAIELEETAPVRAFQLLRKAHVYTN